METVKKRLQSDDYKNPDFFRVCKSVWFQAWKYKDEDQILAALIEEIFKTMGSDSFFTACRAELEKLVAGVSPPAIKKSFSKILAGIDITEIFAELKYKQKLGFYDTFNDFFNRVLWTYLNWQPKVCAAEEINDRKGALVIFIDDLDRCPVERIVAVLETVKLFMDKKGCVFVIGASETIIENALTPVYKDDARKFLEKIVQVTFNLPQIPAPDFQSFVETLSTDMQERIGPHLTMLVPAMQNNPRRVKRFLNNLALREAMLRNREVSSDYKNLLYWNIIDYIYPDLRRDLQDNPIIIKTLKEHLVELGPKLEAQQDGYLSDEMLKGVPQSLHRYLQDKRLFDILKNFTPSTEEIRQFITASTVIKSTVFDDETGTSLRPFEAEAMVEIPAGVFLYGEDKTEMMIEAFAIDIYPVTNRQYERFVQAGGYSGDKFWSKVGRKWRKEEKINQPEQWNNPEWNIPEHPVVGVSYFEAEAYASWS